MIASCAFDVEALMCECVPDIVAMWGLSRGRCAVLTVMFILDLLQIQPKIGKCKHYHLQVTVTAH
jgi:hypothetical protein